MNKNLSTSGNGMTLKQWAHSEFYTALESYRDALTSKQSDRIVAASARVHAAKGGVPKRMHSLVGKAFRGELRK